MHSRRCKTAEARSPSPGLKRCTTGMTSEQGSAEPSTRHLYTVDTPSTHEPNEHV
jgi:hypothetical protein